MIVGHDRPLQVVGFIATRPGDAERGPLIRMNTQEAKARILTDGEIVRIYGPRRFELAPLLVDDSVPRGGAGRPRHQVGEGAAPHQHEADVDEGRHRGGVRSVSRSGMMICIWAPGK